MRERPILFSGPMVRAILSGQKTQNRRPVKPQPTIVEPQDQAEKLCVQIGDGHSGWGLYLSDEDYPDEGSEFRRCPYGAPGDRLWVRETWGGSARGRVLYRASPEQVGQVERDEGGWVSRPGWRPSIHMPRAFSRLTLEVTGVRVERLDAITEEDARAEGMEGLAEPGDLSPGHTLLRRWGGMYDGTPFHAGANPWVWVVEFRSVSQGGGREGEGGQP